MSDELLTVRRRRSRPRPTQRLRIAAAASGPLPAGAAPGEVPDLGIPESGRGRGRGGIWAGGVSLLVHGGLLGALLAAAWLAPPETQEEEEVFKIERIEEEIVSEEPAPAPKVVAESRGSYDPAPMAKPAQVASPAVVKPARAAERAEKLDVETVSPVQAPREVERAARSVEQARTYQSSAQATPSEVEVDAQAPAIRGPTQAEESAGASAGPEQVARSGSAGVADPEALGSGSSVQEGIESTRDVAGSSEGVRARVNWAVGDSNLRGSGGNGTGPGGVTWGECQGRSEVQSYLASMKRRVMGRWNLPAESTANRSVELRFELDPSGSASRIDVVDSSDPRLGDSAIRAMQSASPFASMSDRVRCLAGKPLRATFRNPTVAN